MKRAGAVCVGCSTAEMAARAGLGMTVDLDLVRRREQSIDVAL